MDKIKLMNNINITLWILCIISWCIVFYLTYGVTWCVKG